MKIKNIIWVFPVAAIIVMAGANASMVDETTVESNMEIGKVSINITETMLDDAGNEIPYVPPRVICPGETVSNIKRITNNGADCWLRLDLENSGDLDISADSFHGFDMNSWVEKDDEDGHIYYYYTEKLMKGSASYLLFDGITFPSTWGNSEADKEVSYKLTVQAVQAKNVTPDFDSDSPWGDVTPVEYQGSVQS